MTKMHTVTTWTTTCVEVEWLPLLVSIQDFVKLTDGMYNQNKQQIDRRSTRHLPMWEKHPSSQQNMWLPTCQTFESLKQCLIYPLSTKLNNKLFIINGELLSFGRYRSVDIPRRYDLFVSIGRQRRLDRWCRGRSVHRFMFGRGFMWHGRRRVWHRRLFVSFSRMSRTLRNNWR